MYRFIAFGALVVQTRAIVEHLFDVFTTPRWRSSTNLLRNYYLKCESLLMLDTITSKYIFPVSFSVSIDQFFTVTVVEYFFFLFDLSHTLIVIATRFYISNPVGFICLDCGLDVSVVTIVPNILMSFHLMHIHTN